MTEAEKKMKRYVNAIERRLNLPPEVKARVMSDFASSIAARREAGQGDEEIYAEFGSPNKAAADLNEQMKEFAYRKSPWRYVFAVLALYGGIRLFSSLLPQLMYWGLRLRASFQPNAASVGIIGGADGPTTIFITRPDSTTIFTHPDNSFLTVLFMLLPLAAIVLGIWGFRHFSRRRPKD